MDVPEIIDLFLDSFQTLNTTSIFTFDCKGEWFRLCGRTHYESLVFSVNLTVKDLDLILMQM